MMHRILDALWSKDYEIDYVEGVDRAVFWGRLTEKVRTSPYFRSWMLEGKGKTEI